MPPVTRKLIMNVICEPWKLGLRCEPEFEHDIGPLDPFRLVGHLRVSVKRGWLTQATEYMQESYSLRRNASVQGIIGRRVLPLLARDRERRKLMLSFSGLVIDIKINVCGSESGCIQRWVLGECSRGADKLKNISCRKSSRNQRS